MALIFGGLMDQLSQTTRAVTMVKTMTWHHGTEMESMSATIPKIV
jgi:hypothetical protein